MTWQIGPLILPIDPELVERRVLRKQEANSIFQQFGIPLDTGPAKFEFVIKGKIWPTELATDLWELAKKPEAEAIEITVTNDPEFEHYTGLYSVNKSTVGSKGPQFVADAGFDNGKDGPAVNYNITFIEYAEPGALGDGDSGDFDNDEDGVAFDFDTNFDFSTFINILGEIFSV